MQPFGRTGIVGAVEPAEKAKEKEAGPTPQSYTRAARLCTNWVDGSQRGDG
jgi:hypothetical protein